MSHSRWPDGHSLIFFLNHFQATHENRNTISQQSILDTCISNDNVFKKIGIRHFFQLISTTTDQPAKVLLMSAVTNLWVTSFTHVPCAVSPVAQKRATCHSTSLWMRYFFGASIRRPVFERFWTEKAPHISKRSKTSQQQSLLVRQGKNNIIPELWRRIGETKKWETSFGSIML